MLAVTSSGVCAPPSVAPTRGSPTSASSRAWCSGPIRSPRIRGVSITAGATCRAIAPEPTRDLDTPAACRYRRPVQGVLTTPERRLRGWLIAHAIWSALLAIGYVAGGQTSTLAFVPNSFAKDVLFAVVSVIAAADVRRFGGLALAIVGAYLALVVGEIATLAWGGASPPDVPVIGEVSATVALLAWMAIDLVLAALFTWLWIAAARARHGLRYLNPVAFSALAALAEVLIEGRREVVPPEEVARNVDGYLADLKASAKGQVQLALTVLAVWPLLT